MSTQKLRVFSCYKKKKKKNETSCTSAAAFSPPFLLLFLCWCAKWRMEWLLTHYYVSSVIHRKAPVIFTHNYFYTISETINSVKRQKSLSIILKTILTHSLSDTGFPGGSAGKKSTCNTGDLSLIPGLRRSPREGKGNPLQSSGLENSMDSIVYRVTKSRIWLSDFHSLKSLRVLQGCVDNTL